MARPSPARSRALVVPLRRNGQAAQASVMLRHRNHLSDVVHRAQDEIDARFSQPLWLAEIAKLTGVSERTLTRRFVQSTAITPLRYQQRLRVERASELIEAGWTQESASREVGFSGPRMLRKLFAAERAVRAATRD